MPFSKVQAVENIERTTDMERVVQPMKGILGPLTTAAPLKDVQGELEKALAPEIQNRVVDIKARKEGLIVRLREMGFYESGSSTMRPSAMGAVDRLAAVLVSRTESMRIEGHTDNVPIHNLHFASNWELSTVRSTELVRLFIDRYHVDPQRLSAAGYAEFHPAADNDSADGRTRNRRIDVVILNPMFGEKLSFVTPGPVVSPAANPPSASPASAVPAQPHGP